MESGSLKNIDLNDPAKVKAGAGQIVIKYKTIFENSKILEKILPRKLDKDKLLELIPNLNYSPDPDLNSIEESVFNPLWNLLDRESKRMRPVLCALFAEAFDKQFEEVIEIAGFIEILHNASLIIDDIEDKGDLRRGQQTIHKIYGIDISINAANLAYFQPINYLYTLQNKYGSETLLKISQIYSQEMTQIHFGQAWDIKWHNSVEKQSSSFPTEQQYMQMVVLKTGALIRMMTRMVGKILNFEKQSEEGLITYSEKIGAAFQIQDDILSVTTNQEFQEGKGFRGEDIYEGKITIMVIHLINNANQEDQQEFIGILHKKTKEKEYIDRAIELLNKYKSIEYAKEKAKQIIEEAQASLEQILPDNEARRALILISKYIIYRSK